MAEKTTGEMQATLGLTGLTMNAMALIAPGAFLWLTFAPQATEGATTPSMWIGIVFALLLCLATAVCYAEMAKLYPGTGSSYYFAEQAFLNHDKAWKYARLMKFIVGWGSHLYYWIYPGVMVAVTGVFCGYITGTLSSRRKRLHGCEHRHQRDSNLCADRVLSNGDQLPDEPPSRQRRPPVGLDDQRVLRLRVRHDEPDGRWHGYRRDHARCEHESRLQGGCGWKTCALPR